MNMHIFIKYIKPFFFVCTPEKKKPFFCVTWIQRGSTGKMSFRKQRKMKKRYTCEFSVLLYHVRHIYEPQMKDINRVMRLHKYR